MHRFPLTLTALALAAAGAIAATPPPAAEPLAAFAPRVLDRTSRTLEKWAGRDPHDLARVEFAEVAETLEDSFTVRASSRDDVDFALLAFAGHCRQHRALPEIDALHRIAHGALQQRLNGRGGTGFAAFVKEQVLAAEGDASPRQRVAACDVLAGHLLDSNTAGGSTATCSGGV